MRAQTKILIVEHDQHDLELLQYELKKGGIDYVYEIVETEQDYGSALINFVPDIILSDFSLPSFDGPSAFQMRQHIAPDTPFIFVSGTIGEENSIELIKTGVTDYALKDKLFTLDTKVKRALNEAKDKCEKQKAEKSLHQSEANLRSIFENTDVGFLLMDRDSNIITANAIIKQWGARILPSTDGHNFKKMLPAEKTVHFDIMMDRVLHGVQIVYETEYPDTDGVLKWFHINGKPVTDEQKNIIGICLSVSDITARKHAEQLIKMMNISLEERVQERTAELSEANKALEAFSYSVSHDLRSPVRAVLGFTKIIREEYIDAMGPEAKEYFAYIDENSKRMAAIIDDLLKLAKYGKQQLRMEAVDMKQLIIAVWANTSRYTPHHAVLDLREMPVVNADASMMEQVVINLLSNAIKFSSKKERPMIKISHEQKDNMDTFCLEDNGAGFDMKDHGLLFGAFQRLHGMSDFEGTGVGLTMVKNIIEKHGGEVSAEGKVNEGAKFCFSLPVKNQ